MHIGDNYKEVLCFLELVSGSSTSTRYAGRAATCVSLHRQSEHLLKKTNLCMEHSNPHFPSYAENKELWF